MLFSACGEPHGIGTIEGEALPLSVVAQRSQRQAPVFEQQLDLPSDSSRQILFGDLHVHTTYSIDAFLRSLPMMQGDGLHPVSDACDFARYCSDLDFWSINDHAVSLSTASWRATKESIRQCNALAGDSDNPDLVSFLGWEWTQAGETAANHWGHKNVIFKGLAEDEVPVRPIQAAQEGNFADIYSQLGFGLTLFKWPLLDPGNGKRYFDFISFLAQMRADPVCEEGIDTRSLPADCREVAATPAVLFKKLNEWGYEPLVIPHGNAWGIHTPADTSWDKQLEIDQHDEAMQTLLEVYSGHGNSEEYRDFRSVAFDEAGERYCPSPSEDYLACCWQAGEIIRGRCEDASSAECEARVQTARSNYLDLEVGGHLAVSGESVEEWLNCGQCTDCFTPAFNYRPKVSSQYAMAISDFSGDEPRRFRFGFIGSSDNHSARPGTGYKEYERRRMTEGSGPNTPAWIDSLYNHRGDPAPASKARSEISVISPLYNISNMERASSFFMTGGLVAVHSQGRSRDDVWSALQRKEVYGTSGPRILLWFDLLNGPDDETLPMGSETKLSHAPHFEVRAAGAFKQKPGCPEHSLEGLSPDRLESLCRGECYNPSDERLKIERIEIVRIKPQRTPDEPVGNLIEDPWRSFACPDDEAGCSISFSDDRFVDADREFIYYARAIQEATPAVNGGGLRCKFNDKGDCIEVDPCYGDSRTDLTDDCMTEVEQRAWSSPIFVLPAASMTQ
jgi:hypothetical protein